MRIIGFGHDKQTDQGHLSEGKNIPLFLPQWGQVLEMRDVGICHATVGSDPIKKK